MTNTKKIRIKLKYFKDYLGGLYGTYLYIISGLYRKYKDQLYGVQIVEENLLMCIKPTQESSSEVGQVMMGHTVTLQCITFIAMLLLPTGQ